ncbi:MAG: hypothetical protein QXJ74_01235 [Nitrososphaera sp.]|uniref:hypothetical protein n=1 Tax=Nitrososphaera sp. TaxID=1971748 RepID=UPI0031739313
MKKAALALALALPLLLFAFKPAFAHNEAEVGDIRIVGGWGIEPPLIGQLNTIVIQVTSISTGDPVTNAFANANVVVKKGGVQKALELTPAEEAGWYEAEIIPTQLGQYAIAFSGRIGTQQVNTQIELEDVEDTKRLNFPEGGDSNQGIPEDFVDQMRQVITGLTVQVENANTSAQNASDAAASAAQSAGETRSAADRAYLVGLVGIGVGVAGIAIAAVALSKKA